MSKTVQLAFCDCVRIVYAHNSLASSKLSSYLYKGGTDRLQLVSIHALNAQPDLVLIRNELCIALLIELEKACGVSLQELSVKWDKLARVGSPVVGVELNLDCFAGIYHLLELFLLFSA
jgi:hypothetical protein